MLHAEGPLLSIDLTERTTTTEPIDNVLRSFVGGRGVGTALAHERTPFDADPLGPDNRAYLTTGPLQASQMSFTGRTSVTAVSPLTDGLLSSNAGGFLSRNLIGTGHPAIELRGAADELLAVHVRDDGVTFEAVPDLAGAEVPAVTEWADRDHDLGPEHLACVGPAGENEVRFAAVMTSESRAFGRGGIGAVLGAKNVKVLTFAGDAAPQIEVSDPPSGDIHREAATADHIMKRQGTTSVTDLANAMGTLPTGYFEDVSFDGAAEINGDAVEEKKHKRGTCSQCAFACKLPTKDEAAGVETEGPEFETVMAWGSNQLVDDVVEVMKANSRCDSLGVDTISAGDVVAAYLASEDALGEPERAQELLEKIARREGVGDRLAEGVHRVADELGVPDWTVKGLEFPAHDGRTLHGQGLSFAVANRGADHMYATFYAYEYPLVGEDDAFEPTGLPSPKVDRLIRAENQRAFEDCGIVCRFARGMVTPERLSALFDADYDDLLAVGSRVVELERSFNNRRGFDRDDDDLPYDIEGFEAALDAYYDARGWNDDGTVPDPASSVDAAAD